ncbi:MAG: hypothetical protein LBQ81_04140 [Zoogloeaceae bacterium]|jgi:tetratricopeptide (TPR) repeat protein|nr:hypothetical protein [Zoogloeaceae bacterium]
MANDGVLIGSVLVELMDRLEADLEESGSSTAIQLLDRLRARPLRADSLEAVERLHRLWMQAGDAVAARAVVMEDGASVLRATPPADKTDAEMSLAIYRLQIAEYLDEEVAMKEALAQIRALVGSPGLHADRYLDCPVFDRLEDKKLVIALGAVTLRHALKRIIPERAACRAWDEAVAQSRYARALARNGQGDKARAAADKAITALKTAMADQEVDENDGLRLGDTLIEIVPERLADFQAVVTALANEKPLPQRRAIEVRVVRLAARARHARGDLAGALEVCANARYSLDSDGGDDFIEYELPWLIEAGRSEEAGQRAFFNIYQMGADMWQGTAHLVHERLADAADHSVWWPLCVMQACNTADTLKRLMSAGRKEGKTLAQRSAAHQTIFGAVDATGKMSKPEIDRVFNAARTLAKRCAPDHPWITRLSAVQDADMGRIDAVTQVMQLKRVTQENRMEDRQTAVCLFRARTKLVGLMETLKFPPPSLPGGLWCDSFIADIEGFIEKNITALPEMEQDEAWRYFVEMKRAVLKQGVMCMENYFSTGKGNPYDACALIYAILCKNLANIYIVDERFKEAIGLCQRGIVAYPFIEHYDGILHARIWMGDPKGVVDAAEQLWQFAMEHGYGRLDFNWSLTRVAESLCGLSRDEALFIWLERLVTWQREIGMDEGHLPVGALRARLDFAFFIAQLGHHDVCGSLWRRFKPQVDASSAAILSVCAGDILANVGKDKEALAYYERALSLNENSDDYDDTLTERVTEVIESYREPNWWEVWKY